MIFVRFSANSAFLSFIFILRLIPSIPAQMFPSSSQTNPDSDFTKNKFDSHSQSQGQNLVLSMDGLIVTHKGTHEGENSSIKAEMPIRPFNLGAVNKNGGYFEVKIRQKVKNDRLGIGIYGKQSKVGSQFNSVVIWRKGGIWIDGHFHRFKKINIEEFFNKGDVAGIGLLRFPDNPLLKCFVTLNGEFIGTIELPNEFFKIELFPMVSLAWQGESIKANFGQEPWLFNSLIPPNYEKIDDE